MKKVMVLAALLMLQGSLAHAIPPQVLAEIVESGSEGVPPPPLPGGGFACDARELQILDNGAVIATQCGQGATTILTLAAGSVTRLQTNIAKLPADLGPMQFADGSTTPNCFDAPSRDFHVFQRGKKISVAGWYCQDLNPAHQTDESAELARVLRNLVTLTSVLSPGNL